MENTDTNLTPNTDTDETVNLTTADSNQTISVNSNIIDIPLLGLIKRQTYNYAFIGTGGSAPAMIYPTGGIFTAASKEHILTANVTFCRNSNLCKPGQDGVLPYENNGSSPYTSFVVRLEADGDISYSKVVHLSCQSNCFQEISHSYHNGTMQSDGTVLLDDNSKNKTRITSKFENLLRDTSYYYDLDTESTDLSLLITPSSGVFLTSSESYDLSYDIEFDASTATSSDHNFLSSLVVKLSGVSANNDIGTYTAAPLVVRCQNCLPFEKVSATTINRLDINGAASIFQTDILFDNLIHDNEYTYNIDIVDSNWPISIYPISGDIADRTTDIKVLSAFCPNKFDCSEGYAQPTTQAMIKYNKFANIEISLYKNGNKIDTISQYMSCVDCPQPPQVDGPSSITLASGVGCETFDVSLSRLYPSQKYKYRFDSLSSNWPTVISPHSGSFIPNATDYTLPFRLFFCASTGLCPNETPGVLNYTINNSDYIFNTSCSKYTNFKFILEEDLAISIQNNDSTEIASSITNILCEDCLPENAPVIPLSSGNDVPVPSGNTPIIVNPPSTSGNQP
jgi:hypothetical protein